MPLLLYISEMMHYLTTEGHIGLTVLVSNPISDLPLDSYSLGGGAFL